MSPLAQAFGRAQDRLSPGTLARDADESDRRAVKMAAGNQPVTYPLLESGRKKPTHESPTTGQSVAFVLLRPAPVTVLLRACSSTRSACMSGIKAGRR